MAMILFFCYILLHYSHTGNICMYFSPANINVLQSSRSTGVIWHPLNLFWYL